MLYLQYGNQLGTRNHSRLCQKTCKICGDKHFSRGLCQKHYQRLPENRIKQHEYNQRPEVKKRHREYERKRGQRLDVRAKNKEYQQRPEVKAKNRKHVREYYQQDSKARARKSEYNRQRYQHPEIKAQVLAYQKQYIQRPETKLKMREWRQLPETKILLRKLSRRRRARKNNIIENFTTKQWEAKIKATNGICPGYNRKPHHVGKEKLTLDHDPPISRVPKGFIYTIDNVNPLCGRCNCSKHARIEQPITTRIANFVNHTQINKEVKPCKA